MKLFVVGVGPGDPELLTLKAKKVIEASDTLFCPKGGRESLALSVVEKVVDLKDKRLIHLNFPMVRTKEERERLRPIWEDLANKILSELGNLSSFITLGDPTIYSTIFYLYEHLKDRIEIEFIPGVSSITASASRIPLCLGLGDEKIAILPANYEIDLESIANKFETIVLLKPNKVFKAIQNFFPSQNFETFYIKKATTSQELIVYGLDNVLEKDLDYFSIVIAKKRVNLT